MNKRGALGFGQLLALMAVFCVMLFGVVYLGVSLSGVGEPETKVIKTESGEQTFAAYDVEFQMIAGDGSDAQDAEADLDIDILEWDASKNDQLAGRSGSQPKYYLDCANAKPVKFDGEHTDVDVPDSALCKVNAYKFWASFTAGDSETYLDDVLTLTKADLDDVDGSGTMEYQLRAGKTYLVTVTEGADADEDDVVPFAFLLSSDTTTTLNRESLEDGSINVRFSRSYWSDAVAHSKIQVSGECEDNQGNDMNLDSSLNGAISSSLTTATTINLDCDIDVEITEDGYALLMRNELAESESEKPYVKFIPFGESNDDNWIAYGTGNLTGDVGYSSSDSASDQIIWEGSTACGVVLTDDSATDAVKYGDEKLRDISCLVDLYDDNAKLTMPISITQVKVDYDASADGGDETVDANSGSSAEDFFNITMIGMESSTAYVTGQTLSG